LPWNLIDFKEEVLAAHLHVFGKGVELGNRGRFRPDISRFGRCSAEAT
jgi:hypothetical protein